MQIPTDDCYLPCIHILSLTRKQTTQRPQKTLKRFSIIFPFVFLLPLIYAACPFTTQCQRHSNILLATFCFLCCCQVWVALVWSLLCDVRASRICNAANWLWQNVCYTHRHLKDIYDEYFVCDMRKKREGEIPCLCCIF